MQDINSLCEALPSLEILNLSSNLMETDVPVLPSLTSIRILVLNNCGITWKQVMLNKLASCLFFFKFHIEFVFNHDWLQIERLGQFLHAIEELHLMGNKMTLVSIKIL